MDRRAAAVGAVGPLHAGVVRTAPLGYPLACVRPAGRGRRLYWVLAAPPALIAGKGCVLSASRCQNMTLHASAARRVGSSSALRPPLISTAQVCAVVPAVAPHLHPLCLRRGAGRLPDAAGGRLPVKPRHPRCVSLIAHLHEHTRLGGARVAAADELQAAGAPALTSPTAAQSASPAFLLPPAHSARAECQGPA